MNVGPWEIAIFLVIVLLLFGAKKLPELARSLGRSSSEFKKGMQEGSKEDAKPAEPAAEDETD